MALRHSVYSTLLVSDSEKITTSLTSFLPEGVFSPIDIVTSVNEAQRLFSEKLYDIVIINGPLSDDTGVDLAFDLVGSNSCAVLFLSGDSRLAEMRGRFTARGIYTLIRPASSKTINQIILDLCAMRERLRSFEKKVVSVEEKMAEIRNVNKAKWLLIDKKGMSEDEAHQYVIKNAMENSMAKGEFAKLLIKNLS